MQAKLQAAGPTLRLWIKDCGSWAFAVIDVCHIIHRLNKCIPPPLLLQPITSLTPPPSPQSVPAHSFASHQKHFPAAAFSMRGPLGRKGGIWRAPYRLMEEKKGKKEGVKMLLAWKCSEIRRSQNRQALLNKSG